MCHLKGSFVRCARHAMKWNSKMFDREFLWPLPSNFLFFLKLCSSWCWYWIFSFFLWPHERDGMHPTGTMDHRYRYGVKLWKIFSYISCMTNFIAWGNEYARARLDINMHFRNYFLRALNYPHAAFSRDFTQKLPSNRSCQRQRWQREREKKKCVAERTMCDS